MATFSAQVVDLVGTFSDETALDSFITAGANEVINAMPRPMQERVAEETSFTNTTTSEGSKVLHVLRNDGTIDQPCRRIPARYRGRIQDSSDMQYATSTDPAYYVQDALVTIFPTGTGKLVSIPTYNQGSALDASSLSTITNFPNEAEYLVTTYAAIKALQQNMSGMMTLAAIDTTALGAITTELNKADDIISTASGKVDAYYTSIGDIDDTTELWDGTNKRFKTVKDSIDKARTLLSDDAEHAGLTDVTDEPSSGTYSVLYWLGQEDTEMVTASLGMVSAELQKGNSAIAEVNNIIDSYKKYISGVDHTLWVIVKGSEAQKAVNIFRNLEIEIRTLEVKDSGFDLGSYTELAKLIRPEWLFLLNSNSEIMRDNWLLKFWNIAQSNKLSVVGSMASFSSYADGGSASFYKIHPRNIFSYLRQIRDTLNRIKYSSCWRPSCQSWNRIKFFFFCRFN